MERFWRCGDGLCQIPQIIQRPRDAGRGDRTFLDHDDAVRLRGVEAKQDIRAQTPCGEGHAAARLRRTRDKRLHRHIDAARLQRTLHLVALPGAIGFLFQVLHSAAAAIGEMTAHGFGALGCGLLELHPAGAPLAHFGFHHFAR